MGDIAYATGQEVIQFVATQSAQVAGSSAIDTAAALRAAEWAKNGGGSIVSFPFTVIKGGVPVSLEAQYASQLWDYWKITAGAAVSSVGAAASASVAWAQGVLFGNPELAGTLAGSGGLLTMSLPAAASVMTPLLGVSIGGALYESNPELWTKISQTLLPFCYDDKDTIGFVVDSLGQVFAPKGAIDALKRLFEDEGVGGPEQRTLIPEGSEFNTPLNYANLSSVYWNGYYVDVVGSVKAALFSDRFVITGQSLSDGIIIRTRPNGPIMVGGPSLHTFSYNGLTSFVGYAGTRMVKDFIATVVSVSAAQSISNNMIGWYMDHGVSRPTGGYPIGLEEWEGDSVDVSQLTNVDVVSDLNGNTTPYIPLTLPTSPSTTSPDPQVQPSPIAPVQPDVITPYISPATIPEIWPEFPSEVPTPAPGARVGPQVSSDPIYVPAPVLNPNVDPSALPDTELADDLPTNIDPPISGGQSPDPIFPVPDIQFPCWTPLGSDTPVVSGQPGFIQIYHPSTSEFISFGRWLWVTYNDATIDKIWNNPFDGVIGAHELYATPADGGYSTIRCGFLDSGISTQVVNQRYTQINCGSILIPEYWGNYLDYSPYSQCMIYLPFIGIVDLEVDDIVGAAINVLYHIDSYTGSCIAQITVAKEDYSNTLYQFSGNCSVEIPMAGASQAQIKAALMTANAYQNAANVSATAALVGGIGSGLASLTSGVLGGIASPTATGSVVGLGMGIASGIGSAISGAASAESQRAYGSAQHTANMLSGKAIVQHSGSFGSSHGAMGIKKPYLIIRRPIQKVVNGYQDEYGFPAHKQVIIGSCKGFLRCREVHVVSSLATDAEKTLIEQLLTSGVYVTESVD